MITLTYPNLGTGFYVNCINKGCYLGPFSPSLVMDETSIGFKSIYDSLGQSHGFYHENFVDNCQSSGLVKIRPEFGNLSPAPTSSLPQRVTFRAKDGYGNNVTVTANNGMASGDFYSFELNGSYYYHRAYRLDPSTKLWTIHELQCPTAYPTRIAMYTKNQVSSIMGYTTNQRKVVYTRSTYNFSPGKESGVDWSKQSNYLVVSNPPIALPSPAVSANIAAYCNIYSVTNTIPKITAMEQQIDLRVVDSQVVEYPIPDEPYGNLAMRASEKTNANQVNMIAFLRDLRHPTEMIPKLKNLSKLTTLADNYLTVKYGILPTIDDLKSILEAVRRQAPYLDRNGFSTYSAGNHLVLDRDGNHYDKYQQIKLAISDEDCLWQDLVGRAESIGMLPTLKNVWDLVPYSFVIDWFLDLGSFLERVDTRLRLMRLNIRYVTMSRKTITRLNFSPSASVPLQGTVEVVHYHRWVTDQCPVPPLSLQSNIADFNHWLESGALLIQRAH